MVELLSPEVGRWGADMCHSADKGMDLLMHVKL